MSKIANGPLKQAGVEKGRKKATLARLFELLASSSLALNEKEHFT
jgi:hypothetical protein